LGDGSGSCPSRPWFFRDRKSTRSLVEPTSEETRDIKFSVHLLCVLCDLLLTRVKLAP
jgi:hypothetical protein